MKTKTAFQQIMDQPIGMPGFYGLTVTRGWAYMFLKNCGWDESERGFGSLDYTIFAAPISSEPLTPLGTVFRFLADDEVLKSYQRGV